MKRPRLVTFLALVIAVLAAAGLTVGLTGSARATPARPALHSGQIVVFDCFGSKPLVKPKTFILACGDGNAYFKKLSWTSWTPGLASAKGTYVQNDCIPYCAAGHFHSYPAVVVLWGSKAVKGHPGEQAYTTLTEILTGTRPRFYNDARHKWITAPVTQNFPLLPSPMTLSPA